MHRITDAGHYPLPQKHSCLFATEYTEDTEKSPSDTDFADSHGFGDGCYSALRRTAYSLACLPTADKHS